jgi:thymidylate synthase (FAD)
MHVKLQNISPNIENNIVEIARVSSSRKDKTEDISGLVNYLIKNKHWSPFEHGSLTMEIKTSKAIGIQLLRHRSFTFQELSQRYAVVGESEPIELRQQHANNRQSSSEIFDPYFEGQSASQHIEEYIKRGQALYESLLAEGVARECARFVLPMSTSTTIYMSGTVRSWIHLIQIRDDEHAQLEAQVIARLMKDIFIKEMPVIAKALGWI